MNTNHGDAERRLIRFEIPNLEFQISVPVSPWLKLYAIALLLLLACARPAAAQESGWVRDAARAGDFELVRDQHAADVLVSAEDFKVVRIAVRTEATGLSQRAVLVGTLGKSPFIDRLAREGKLDAKSLRGKWESFL